MKTGSVFVVVSYCSKESEGWFPQASNNIINEFLLEDSESTRTHINFYVAELVCMHFCFREC